MVYIGLPFLKMGGSFHGKLLNNQKIFTNVCHVDRLGWRNPPCTAVVTKEGETHRKMEVLMGKP